MIRYPDAIFDGPEPSDYMPNHLAEDKVETIVEFFGDLCDMIFGRKPIDIDQIDFDIDEICAALKMSRPPGDVCLRSV